MDRASQHPAHRAHVGAVQRFLEVGDSGAVLPRPTSCAGWVELHTRRALQCSMKSLPDMLQRSMIVHHAQHLHSPTIGEEIVMARTARTEADEAIDVTEKMQM